jgi:hypothetical protein
MPDKCVERFDPTLDRIIDRSGTIHDLADGACGKWRSRAMSRRRGLVERRLIFHSVHGT